MIAGVRDRIDRAQVVAAIGVTEVPDRLAEEILQVGHRAPHLLADARVALGGELRVADRVRTEIDAGLAEFEDACQRSAVQGWPA